MKNLKDLRVRIVEDESLVVMYLKDILEEMGGVVAGVAGSASEAVEMIGMVDFEAAVLDVNLSGGRSIAVASLLREIGVPFVFATGYGQASVPKELADVPLLWKPFTSEDLMKALVKACDISKNPGLRRGRLNFAAVK